EIGVPGELLAVLQQAFAKFLVASAVLDVPLASGNDLERLVPLLEELHLMRDLTNLADEFAARLEKLDDRLLRAEDGLSSELRVGVTARGARNGLGRF